MAKRRAAEEDAPIVAALKAAGAMLIGKSASVEFGVNPLGYNSHQGTPRNPHDTSRLTGGSSSGTAGIIASGICPISTGALTCLMELFCTHEQAGCVCCLRMKAQ